jgi:hypothetical protein
MSLEKISYVRDVRIWAISTTSFLANPIESTGLTVKRCDLQILHRQKKPSCWRKKCVLCSFMQPFDRNCIRYSSTASKRPSNRSLKIDHAAQTLSDSDSLPSDSTLTRTPSPPGSGRPVTPASRAACDPGRRPPRRSLAEDTSTAGGKN